MYRMISFIYFFHAYTVIILNILLLFSELVLQLKMAEYTDAFSASDEYIQHICDLCIQDDQEIEAKAFCTVCMQYICQSCYK